MPIRTEETRRRIATVVLLGLVLTACDAGAPRSAKPHPRAPAVAELRASTLPPLDVDWSRTRLVGGPDRLLALTGETVYQEDGPFEVHEFDPSRWRWRRRPPAPGFPLVVTGGLVAVSLRCGPWLAYENRRCDSVAHGLRDGTDRWTATRITKHRHNVHELDDSTPVGSSGPEGVFTTLAGLRAVSLDGVRAVPMWPRLMVQTSTGGFTTHDPVVTCVAGRRLVQVMSDGVANSGQGPGVAWITSMDLDRASAGWSRPVRTEVPAGAWSATSFGCWGRGAIAFSGAETLQWSGGKWTVLTAVTPKDVVGPSASVATASDVIAASNAPGYARVWLWLHRDRWTTVPPGPVEIPGYPGPRIAALGPHVVNAVGTATGPPELRVLTPPTA